MHPEHKFAHFFFRCLHFESGQNHENGAVFINFCFPPILACKLFFAMNNNNDDDDDDYVE